MFITDIRCNPRAICVDGKRLAFPSKKEVSLNISVGAAGYLKTLPFIKLRVPEEDTHKGEIVKVAEEPAKIEEPAPAMEPAKVQNAEAQAQNTAVEPAKEEAVKVPEPAIGHEEVLQDSEIIAPAIEEPDSPAIAEPKDYASMPKRDLRALVESKGGDPTGMSKANMVDWLKANA